MSGGGWVAAALVVASVCLGATTITDMQQSEKIDQLGHSVARLEQQRDRDLEQIQQLNRKVFDLPTITQDPTGGDR
jgi:hypothetical protein